MYIAILGRQPAIGIAELEAVFGRASWLSAHSALFEASSPDIERLGGALKLGRVVFDVPSSDWRRVSMKIVDYYTKAWARYDGKITLGISVYDLSVSVRDIQKTGLILKNKLKGTSTSLRLVPNTDAALSTATSHHNKLGLSANKVELLIVRAADGRVYVAESAGAQNITALARRDQGRPKRDAFVGMLPPKLAQIMINLAVGEVGTTFSSDYQATATLDSQNQGVKGRRNEKVVPTSTAPIILDPFCGTGVLLQEAVLMGYAIYGTDLADKMIDYSEQNLAWLAESHHLSIAKKLEQGDATTHKWSHVDAVVAETYLGQPFSAPPSPPKLKEVVGNCNHIISEFLKNIAPQLDAGTPLCLAVPAWRDKNGGFTHLPLIKDLEKLGFTRTKFESVTPDQLLYYREDQVVARELLVLARTGK